MIKIFALIGTILSVLPTASLLAAGPSKTEAATSSNAVTSYIVEAGDTLERLFDRAGLSANQRSEVILAVAAEFDARALRPGNRLTVSWRDEGRERLASVELQVDDGVRVIVDLARSVEAHTIKPKVQRVEKAVSGKIEGSLFATLGAVGAPQRLAVELPELLAGLIDFRRDLRGGETLKLAWEEVVDADTGEVFDTFMRYAQVTLSDRRYEIILDGDVGELAVVLRNGRPVRRIEPPVSGARLSSAFGRRMHPVLGAVRLHTGVDYAASKGEPVFATSRGTVGFVGRMAGYGQIVDIDHGDGMVSRYAHLSQVINDLNAGDPVEAGNIIGRVGRSGMTTGPNLHYEIRVDGKPVDPLDPSNSIEPAILRLSPQEHEVLAGLRAVFAPE